MQQRLPRPIAFVILLAVLVAALFGGWQLYQSRPAQAAGFPARYFAPYVDTGLYPTFPLTQTAQQIGVKFYTLAFIINGGGSCQAEWNGTTPVNQGFLQSDISNLRALGGDVIVSFGGANGIELAQACSSVSSLQAQYQAVVTNYQLTRIDFDIEGAAIADSASVDRRNKAIAALQAANPGLFVSYTLPVMPSGLTQDGINLLQNAITNGVNVGMVNIMAMDYGSSAPPNQMGQNAISAAQSTFNQLKSLYPSKSSAQLWAMIGVTPMIGLNDVSPEVFTLQDAQQLLSFAQQNGLGELSMWSAGRDQSCPNNGAYVSPTCSGIQQQPFDFSKLFNQFTGGSVSNPTPTPTRPPATPTPTPGRTPTPTATPSPTPGGGNLVANPGFESGSLAPWSCDAGDRVVTSPVHSGSYALQLTPSNSTTGQCTQTISVQPNHTYTLSAYVNGPYAYLGISSGASNWTSSTSYTLLSVSFTTGASTTSVTIYVHGWYAQGPVYVDDVALR
ncbi:carbohydrate binding domain-containing protein [Thermogemmatispora sp.]|uniref:carbohydrate binding domain-containing protein n=1 Tax=Thermogemmatispora sp. TaxID=1968838 RepID=UPI0035E4559E